MLHTRGVEAASHRPGPARLVIQFRTRGRIEIAITTSCNEDLAVGQQGRSVIRAAGIEAARGRPSLARRIVQFRTRESAAIITPCNEDLAIGQ